MSFRKGELVLSFELGKISVERGGIRQGFYDVAPKCDGSYMRFPVIVANGMGKGPVLLVTAGVHGDEPNGTLALTRLMQSVDPNKLKGTLVGVPVVNLEAFSAKKRGSETFDNYKWDVNRAFPGKADGYPVDRMAHAFFNEIALRADYHIDLHSGADWYLIVDSVLTEKSEGEAFELAKNSGARIIVPFPEPGTLTSALDERNIPSLGFEVGCSVMAPEDCQKGLDLQVRFCQNVMRRLGMLEGKPELPRERYILEDIGLLRVDIGGLALLEPELQLMQKIRKGTLLGRVYDIFGNELQKMYAPYDGLLWAVRLNPVVQPGDYGVCWLSKIRETLS